MMNITNNQYTKYLCRAGPLLMFPSGWCMIGNIRIGPTRQLSVVLIVIFIIHYLQANKDDGKGKFWKPYPEST